MYNRDRVFKPLAHLAKEPLWFNDIRAAVMVSNMGSGLTGGP